jgi:hypothetical protein
VARTAVIAGTATAVSNRVSRRQQARWAAEDQTAYGPPDDDLTAQFDQLAVLRQRGQITDEEYAAAKARLLGL